MVTLNGLVPANCKVAAPPPAVKLAAFSADAIFADPEDCSTPPVDTIIDAEPNGVPSVCWLPR